MEMMRHLRHVNVDHLHVGWYQSTYFGSFINKVLLHSQYEYQHTIEESVVLVYGSCSFCVEFMFIINLIIGAFTMRNRFSDPLKTAKGHLSLKALRLTPAIMDLYRDQDFTPDRCVECVHTDAVDGNRVCVNTSIIFVTYFMQHREERHQLPGDVRGGSGRRQELAPQQRDAVRGGGTVAAGGEVQLPRPRHQLGDGEEPASDDGERRRTRAGHQQVLQLPATVGQARGQQEAIPAKEGRFQLITFVHSSVYKKSSNHARFSCLEN